MKIFIALLTGLLLSGCASNNLQQYGKIDRSNKTITVPPGSWGLNGALKHALSKDGWRLIVYQDPSITEGKIGERTKIKQYDSFNSRYRLVVSSSQFDWCFNLSPAIAYDLSLIDNRSGSEVFTMNGRDCESDVANKFTDALHGK